VNSIILDQEKGVDPMLSYCFYCQKEKNELILAGVAGRRIRREAGANTDARGLCFSKEPCDECKSIMEQGVIFISVKDGEHGSDNPYRTGGWCALTLEAAERMGIDIEKQRVFFIEDSMYDKIGLPRNKNIDNRKREKE